MPAWQWTVWAVLAGISLGSSLLLLIFLLHYGGAAFSVFYGAAVTLRHGGTPYRAASGLGLNTVFPYLPWVAVGLLPFSYLPFATAFSVWVVLSGTIVGASTWAFSRSLDWTRWGLLVGAVVCSSVLWRCLLTGQMDAWVLLLETLALLSAMKARPSLAGGFAAAGALLKPQILWALPLLLLLIFINDGRSRAFILSGLATAGVLLLVPAVAFPRLLPAWLHLLPEFASSVSTVQPDLAGLPGLLRFAPASWGLRPGLSSPITLLIVGCGLALMGWLTWQAFRARGWAQMPRNERVTWTVALPLGVWFLVTPYSHSNDMLVLIPLLVVALGPNGKELGQLSAILTVASLVVLPEFFLFLNVQDLIGPLSLASISVFALVLFAWSRSPWRLSPDQPADTAWAPRSDSLTSERPGSP